MEKKMKEKWLPHIIAVGAFVAFIVLGLACATTPQPQVEKIDNAESLKEYLESQPENSPSTPIRISMSNVNDSTLKDVVDVLRATDKYINLDLGNSDARNIGESAFHDCKSLTVITLPVNLTKIDPRAFYGCTNLSQVLIDSNCRNFSSSENGILYNKDKTILLLFPQGKTDQWYIGADVAPYAFYGSNITKVTLRGGGFSLSNGRTWFQYIHKYAFTNCTNLTSVTFDGFVIEIEEGSFDGNLFNLLEEHTTSKKEDGSLTRNISKGTFTTTAPVDKNSKWTKQ